MCSLVATFYLIEIINNPTLICNTNHSMAYCLQRREEEYDISTVKNQIPRLVTEIERITGSLVSI